MLTINRILVGYNRIEYSCDLNGKHKVMNDSRHVHLVHTTYSTVRMYVQDGIILYIYIHTYVVHMDKYTYRVCRHGYLTNCLYVCNT